MATEAVNERGAGEGAGTESTGTEGAETDGTETAGAETAGAETVGAETAGRRRYDSPLRREQAARTRDRILSAGSELVHEFTTWDWRGLTFRAVAERAGVGERTVYRYFATERDLHDAIMRRLGEDSGISYDGLSLDKIGLMTERLFAALPSYAINRWDNAEPVGPTLLAEEMRRREAVADAVAAPTADWTDEEGRMAAAMLDLLWSVPSYQRLVSAWALDGQQATRAITWAIGVLAEAIRSGHRPPPAAQSPPDDGPARF